MHAARNEGGHSVVELLCGIFFAAVVGALGASVLLASLRRAQEIHQHDLQTRRSERVFGAIADAVRGQREAPGLPLWRVLNDTRALEPWPPSVPRQGPRSPLTGRALLAFGRVGAEDQWRIIRNDSSPSLGALPLCRQPLFTGVPKAQATQRHFLGIAPDRLIPLRGRITPLRDIGARCYGQSAVGAMEPSSTPWPFLLRGGDNGRGGPTEARDLIALREIVDGFVLYLDHEQTIRRASLVTSENQPVATGVGAFQLSHSPLPFIAEEALIVTLDWQEGARHRRVSERWILPVAAIGEQLLGIL